jgi:hypothetical protein
VSCEGRDERKIEKGGSHELTGVRRHQGPLQPSRFLASSSNTSSNFEGAGTAFPNINLHNVEGS